MHILVLISVFITVKSMDYAYEDSDAWTDFDQEKGSIGSALGWRSRNDTVLPYHGPENDKGQRSLQRSVSKQIVGSNTRFRDGFSKKFEEETI